MRRFLIGGGVVAGVLAVGLRVTAPEVPSYAEVRARVRGSDLLVRARGGEPLQEIRIDSHVRRFGWVELDVVPDYVEHAIVFSEDRRFRSHAGVDWRAIVRGGLSAGERGGGSTVTMQLAGLVAPALRPRGRARTVREKFGQIRYARALEARWSKDQILETYLNLAPFRGESEGLAGAARLSFGKDVSGLSPGEALIVAVLLRAPNAPARVIAERACRLREDLEIHDPVFRDVVSCADLTPLAERAADVGIAAARKVVFQEAPQLGRAIAQRRRGERDVRATIDRSLQRYVTEQLRAQLATLAAHGVADGAALVVANETGEVLSYVANGGSLSSARHVDGIRAKRQAGSTLKPFLYGLALERRLVTADTLLNDAPLEIPIGGSVYRPRNYDDTYHGRVSVRMALAGSLNIPAVMTVERVGVPPFVDLLERLGITNLAAADAYGPSIALGSAVVSLWELVDAYRTLARGGERSTLTLLADEPSLARGRVLDPGAAAIVGDILSDRSARSLTFGLENPLATPYWTAVKTGTSKDMTDNWCIGYSRDFTVGVWVGNFSGQPMRQVTGTTGAAPLWARIFDRLASAPNFQMTASEFPPEVLVRATGGAREIYLSGTEPPAAGAPRVSADRRPVQVVSPANGGAFAIDPAMPAAVQRIPFEASGDVTGVEWYLGEQPLGPANVTQWWSPEPGRHEVSLRTAEGRVVAQSSFTVRGAVSPSKGRSSSVQNSIGGVAAAPF